MNTEPLPPLDAIIETAAVVALPMRERFRGITEREAMIFRGPWGWGEFSPFVEYDDIEASSWLAAGLEAAWQPPPRPIRESVAINATVPAVDAALVPDILARYPGAHTAKVKVAEPEQTLDDDVARVCAVADRIENVRIDANGKWTVDDAVAAINALESSGIALEYAEQPCASIGELAAVRARVCTPIAADESIRRAEDPLRVVRADAADVAVVKVAPLGGARRVLALAAQIDIPIVVSSALDTAVGISAAVAVAAALPGSDRACGLGTGSMFTVDVAEPFIPVNGVVMPRQVAPVELLPLAASDRYDWWLARLRRTHAVLAARN